MSERAAGSIYDLGYQRYEGKRLGRLHTFRSLYLESLRSAFGFGRRTSSKVFPFGLLAVASFPAVVQIIIGTFTSDAGVNVELLAAEDYFEFINVVLALFCAAVAPELVGRDLRNRTLAIYFSRAMGRLDYSGAKLAAMVTAMLVVTIGPQTLLFIGNGLVTNDLPGYIQDEWGLIPPIIGSSLLASILLGSIGVAIAAQTPRRMFGTIGILVPLLLTFTFTTIMYNAFDSAASWVAIFLSPINVIDGFTKWFFGGTPEFALTLSTEEPARVAYVLVAVAASFVCAAILVRRYERIDP